MSNDGTTEEIKEYIQEKFPNFLDKFTLIENSNRIYSVGNKNKMIRRYCKSEDIVFDIDADDFILGKQLFKVLNSIYED